MSIAARPVRNSNIITPTRKTARSCATIGRTPAKPVYSNRIAPRARNAVSSDGCTRTFSNARRRGSTRIPTRCAHARDRRASVRHTEDAHGRDALLVRDAAESCHRDGAVRARLQSDTRAKHGRDEAAAGGAEGVIWALARAVAVHRARERAPTLRQDGRVAVKSAQIDRRAAA